MQKRNRPKISVTVSDESFNILNALSPRNKGSFIDDCIRAYLSGKHYAFVTAKHGIMQICGDSDISVYWVESLDGDFKSEEFNTVSQCMSWLNSECPELRINS